MPGLPEPSREDRLVLASLDGRTRGHVEGHTPHDQAVADLRALATIAPARKPRHPQPAAVLRVDLLSIVAGQMHGAHQADPLVNWWGDLGTQLLIDAGGTNQDLGRAAAEQTRNRLGGERRLSS